ncbi:hypothetical protein OE749_07355 [Aestuariibacter sp. AA17]|uniref:Cytochrome c domain-containing protein n=1 Tax=Fluctibacter corallii TaxID=2984329 RepID=A0ABT3A856_9ALTE|nr:hypothetical protein [Aestuariibacter sp. AA17]MCV2884506.1 hypothetical protein [Aestuariibacter sp. AA17]
MKLIHYWIAFWGIVLSASALADDPYQAFKRDPNAGTAFAYLHQVAIHPRCANCHGVVDEDGTFYPTVGEDRRPHPMDITVANNVVLFKDGDTFKQVDSVVLSCRGCHQNTNGDKEGMPPGNVSADMPGFVWHMPQPNMTIPKGISANALCNKWLDPAHNSSHLAQRGGRNDMTTFRKEFLEHHAKIDPLVAWGFNPGPGREKAPGTRADFIRAVEVWIDAGAPCPSE